MGVGFYHTLNQVQKRCLCCHSTWVNGG